MKFETSNGTLTAIFSLTEQNAGSDLTVWPAINPKAFEHGAMENKSIDLNRILMDGDMPAAEASISIETSQPVKAMRPIRYRRGWMAY